MTSSSPFVARLRSALGHDHDRTTVARMSADRPDELPASRLPDGLSGAERGEAFAHRLRRALPRR